MNSILNIAWEDRAYLLECTLHTLRLLFWDILSELPWDWLRELPVVILRRRGTGLIPLSNFWDLFPPQPGFPLSWLWQPPCSGEPCLSSPLAPGLQLPWHPCPASRMWTRISSRPQGPWGQVRGSLYSGWRFLMQCLYFTGLHPGHELLMCCNHDCGDDGGKGRTWMYMNWLNPGRLQQNVCSAVCHLFYFYYCDKGAGFD